MTSVRDLFDGLSVEITGKDIGALRDVGRLLPSRTRVHVTFLANEDLALRRAAAAAVKAHGFTPVPHVAARRLTSDKALADFLGALHADETSEHLFVVAGDPAQPLGPFNDTLALLTRSPLERFGVRTVSISGYPEGHPHISGPALWAALIDKANTLITQDKAGDIVAQFGFDADTVIRWIEDVRNRGIDLPIRVGIPGPAGVKRLMSYASRLGVRSNAKIAKKYGLSLANLLSTAGPDRFITSLAAQLDPSVHGTVRLHFYPFGGLDATAEWIRDFAA